MKTKEFFGKRALSLLLTLLMVISLVPVSLFSAFAAEVETVAVGATAVPYDGVPVTPEKITSSNYQSFGLTDSNWSAYNGYYGIRNAKELYGFANLVNGGNRYVNAVLLQDIVVNETVSASGATYEWVPIGTSSGTSFMGTFDGNGCTISGIYCNYVTATGVGLFGTIGTSAQSNSVNIKNVVLANSYISGSNGLGGIVGCAIGYGATISNCVVSEDVMVVKSTDSATPYTGGIIGQYDGLAYSSLQKYKVCCTVSNCVNLGTVQILTYDFKGNINNRYNIGSITGAYATEDNSFEFIDVNNCYYLSGHMKDKNGNSLKADGTVVDIGKGGETNRMSSRDCTILSSASASHTCVSVNHTEVKATCLYSGLSEYSECLICGAVTSGAKIDYGIDYENHASIDVRYEKIDTANHKVYHDCCGVLKTTEKHNFDGEPTCNTVVTCNNCGGASDLNKDNHTGNLKYTYKNETHHSVSYSCCGAFVEDKEHTYSGGNCVTKEVCEICEGEGSICTDIHASTEIYWNVVSKDHTKHAQYHKCCDAEIENTTAEHEFEDSICSICRYECEHLSMVDGICADCGEGSVKYLDRTWNGTTVVTTEKNTNGMPTAVVSSTTEITLTSGWYMVTEEVKVDANINISGTVHLILMDGATLRATYGIALTGGNTLYIYATSDDPNTMGKLDASTYYSARAGIGSNDYNKSAGSLVINGGTVIAKGAGAGIGGYCSTSLSNMSNNDFNLIVNGGFIQAQGGTSSAGIGSGYKQTGGKITINGGTVIAQGGSSAAGIGGGNGTSGAYITINGGTVTSTGGQNGSGIGRGLNGSSTIAINGGNIKAVAGRSVSGYQAVAISGTPTDSKGNNVYLNTITLDGVTEQKAVSEVNGVESYGLNDVKTLDTNMLYFYLPDESEVTSITAGETVYYCTADNQIYYANHDWSNNDGVCTRCGKDCEHTGGTATCNKKAVCDICGAEYGDIDEYNHIGELIPEFRFDTPYETEDSKECYVELYLTCADCNEFVASTSGYASLVDTKEPTDCMNPGYEIYETTLEIDGVYYPVSHKVTLKSDNHTGEFVNGFCTECGGFEPATLNDNGTPDDEWDDYYEISNAGQLYWFAELAANDQYAKAVLTDDIIVNEDMSAENLREWIAIGESSSMPYCGTFDGQGHFISGLYAKSELNYIGLFGAIGWGATISNLGIKDSCFEGNYYVGGIAGYNDFSYVKNCYAEDVEVVAVSSGGALVGYNYGEVSNSYSTSDSFVGNNNYGTITNCYYLADEEIHDEDGLTFKTAEQFASGEVAYLLQSGVVGEEIWDDELGDYVQTEPEEIWGQKIGEDTYPVFGGDKVYQVENCIGELAYSNANENGQHNFVNGFCTLCGGFEPATLNEDGVYEIGTAGQLYWFAELVNSGNTSANAILTADIVVNEGTVTESSTDARVWTPIGNRDNKYTGAFDGNNKTVSGLYFNNTDTKYVGLFGYIGENGTVKNTGVINSYFNGLWFVGGVVGANYGTITNCYNTGEVSGVYFTGGIVGQNCGTITRSYNTGIIEGFEFIGGVAGCNDGGTITNCYNIGEVSGSYEVGGVVGKNFEGIISNCYNTGEVSGANDYIGGVAGTNQTGTITNCYYLDTAYAGGIGKNNTVEAEDIAGSAEAKTAEQFASGEVAYLLQGEQTEDIWGQKIGTDELPTLGGDKVYYGYASCVDDVAEYTNNSNVLAEKPDHNFVNGFCTVGGEFESATLNSQGFYEISNAGQLYWFADKVNNDYANFKSVKVILTDNIVVNEGVISADSKNVREWIPIGTSISKRFAGVFYGNNKTISGLYCNNEDYDVAGLFGYSEATIAGVGVINSYFSGASVAGSIAGCYIGGRKIENCYSTSIVNAANAGGIVGHTFAVVKVQNCYFTGEVTGTNVGGIVGYFEEDFTGTITNCYYLSTVCSGGINGSDLKGSAEAKTIEQFKSGEVAYLLQGEQSQEIWGQKIGTDELPVLGGDKVYTIINCKDEVVGYSNTEGEILDHNFENGFCTVCGAMDGIAQVKGYSISLGGNIAVNYFMVLSDEVLADENAQMVFTVPNGGSTYEVRIPVSSVTPDANGYYVFTCEVAAKEMTSKIAAQIVTGDNESDVFEYSVKQYAEYILAKAEEANSFVGGGVAGGIAGGDGASNLLTPEMLSYVKAAPLVKAMLNYGANAQLYFNHNTDILANATLDEADKALVDNLDLSEYNVSVTGSEEGVVFYGGALSLKSETAIKLYFVIEEGTAIPEVTVNGKAYELTQNGTLYELKISDIPAHMLSEMYEIKVGGLTISYGAYSYGYQAINTGKEELVNTIKALYAYNQKALEYLG